MNNKDTSKDQTNTARLNTARLKEALSSELKVIYNHTSLYLGELLEKFFQQADNTFFDLAERAPSHQQNIYFDVMRLLRKERSRIIARFNYSLLLGFSQTTVNETNSSVISSSIKFELTKDEELEQDIALTKMQRQIQVNAKFELRDALIRYRILVPDFNGKELDLPFAPTAIMNAIKYGCDGLNIDISDKLIIYKLFERAVQDKLLLLYRRINNALSDRGIEPKLDDIKRFQEIKNTNTIKLVPSQGSPDNNNQASHFEPSTHYPLESIASSPNVDLAVQDRHQKKIGFFQKIRNLLSGKATPTSSSKVNSYSEAEIETATLIEVLHSLQVLNKSAEQPELIDIRSALAGLLKTDKEQLRFGQTEEDIIEVVTMLFNFILCDENIPSQVKVQICRLQIPVLKVAIVDQGLFTLQNHPARRLVNLLAKSAIGWEGVKSQSGKRYIVKVREVVDAVIEYYNEDLDVFKQSLFSFTKFLQAESKRSQLLETRVRQSEEGKLKLARVEHSIDALYARLNQGRETDSCLDEFYESYYRKIMILSVLKNNTKNPQWKKLVSVLSILVWGVQTSLDKSTNLKKRQIAKKLFSEIKTLCNDAGVIDASYKRKVKQLTRRFFGLDDSNKQVDVKNTSNVSYIKKNINPINFKEVIDNDLILDENQIKEVLLKVGTWVELPLEGKPVRCKLAAVIKHYERYIFVNRAGSKVGDYSRTELKQLIENKSIKILDDSALFDRALESVIANLRNLKTANS